MMHAIVEIDLVSDIESQPNGAEVSFRADAGI
jgi:hypothetical protein